MTEERRANAFKYIEAQLNNDYIDLGLNDEDELEIVKEAIQTLKMVDEVCKIGCTSFRLTPEEIERILNEIERILNNESN